MAITVSKTSPSVLSSGAPRSTTPATGMYGSAAFGGATSPYTPPPPLQNPGNNLTNPGYDEQALLYTQNQLLNDPYSQFTQQMAQQAANPSSGESYLNQNLGSLNGPGQGDQYWNQVQGQFMDPFAGEQFTREATQNFSPTGPAGAFYSQAMGQYGDFTGYTGPQNAQGAYGNAQGQLGNGTYGQQGLQGLAGQYDSIGQYNDTNRAAGQYEQTQQAFGDLPIANFDPFFDRARQLGVQSYNQGAAGRGVYGSSEALSGVGNVITDIEAQRALKGFDAEMQRAQEQRMRQQLLGEQARAGDLSSLAAFGANLSGVETFGNINNQMGQLQNQSQSILGQMANNADTQATNAQNANLQGLSTYGNLASNADTAETNRYQTATTAMNNADKTQLDRLETGADIAFKGDENRRLNYQTEASAATNAGQLATNRQMTAANIAQQGSQRDMDRLETFNDTAGNAEGSRQQRQQAKIDQVAGMSRDLANVIGNAQDDLFGADQEQFDDYFNSTLLPLLNEANMSEQDQQELYQALKDGLQIGVAAS